MKFTSYQYKDITFNYQYNPPAIPKPGRQYMLISLPVITLPPGCLESIFVFRQYKSLHKFHLVSDSEYSRLGNLMIKNRKFDILDGVFELIEKIRTENGIEPQDCYCFCNCAVSLPAFLLMLKAGYNVVSTSCSLNGLKVLQNEEDMRSFAEEHYSETFELEDEEEENNGRLNVQAVLESQRHEFASAEKFSEFRNADKELKRSYRNYDSPREYGFELNKLFNNLYLQRHPVAKLYCYYGINDIIYQLNGDNTIKFLKESEINFEALIDSAEFNHYNHAGYSKFFFANILYRNGVISAEEFTKNLNEFHKNQSKNS